MDPTNMTMLNMIGWIYSF